MPTFYSIWKTTKTDGNQPKKVNMTVAQATTYIVKNRDSLKQGEQFFTENQATNEVDMMFTKRDTITPNKPMWLDGNRLVQKNPKTNPQKSMSNYNNPAWSMKAKPKIEYDIIGDYAYISSDKDLSKQLDLKSINAKNLGFDAYGTTWSARVPKSKINQLKSLQNKKSKRTYFMSDSEFWIWTRKGEELTNTEQKRYERLRKNNKFRKQISQSERKKMMKPKTKSRGKWVGNMFRLSNSRLSQLGKTGTPKQKKLAKSIIARRRKK